MYSITLFSQINLISLKRNCNLLYLVAACPTRSSAIADSQLMWAVSLGTSRLLCVAIHEYTCPRTKQEVPRYHYPVSPHTWLKHVT